MTDLIARNKVRLGATSTVVVCVLIISLIVLWQSVWAQDGCYWEKVFWINDEGPFPWEEGASLAVSDTLTIVDTAWCDFGYDWATQELWWEPPLSLVGYDYWVWPGTSYQAPVTGTGQLLWSGGIPIGSPMGMPVVLTKTLHVDSPGWGMTEISEVFNFSFLGEWVDSKERHLELSEMVEGGDAPSSHNHLWLPMTAYAPGGGPPGVVANYPVVWDWDGTLGPGVNGDYGFCHWSGEPVSLLGNFITWEVDADVLPDQDGVTNIDPPGDVPDLDSIITPFPGDDGMQFPTVLPSCGTAMVPIQGVNNSGGTLYLNVWADWNRDGDWDDTSLCTCAVDEWTIKDYPVAAPGPFAVNIPIIPCHPGGDPTAPLWVRVTLAEVPLVGLGTPWSWGGQPYPAFSPVGGPQGCFLHGETEDYYVEPEEPTCDWVKQISINGMYAGDWEMVEPDPFGVVVSDTITISDALQCNFFYDWDLVESWDAAVLSLLGHDRSHGDVVEGTGNIEWAGGDPIKVAPGTWVTLTKTLHVENPEWIQTLIEETLDISPEGYVEPMTRTVTLLELVEGGDAPSSHNHTWSIMHTYNPAFGGVPANFPVVWDFDDSLGPSPVTGYYGFCHWAKENPSYLGPVVGPSKSYELDADLLPDQDGKTNINPPAGTPDWDGHDDGIWSWPAVLPQCGPAIFHVQVNNNSGGTLYLNAWADWNRDGDWEDGSVCGCGDDEWAVQDVAVGPGFHIVPVQVIPCHPGLVPEVPFEHFWMRFTLSPLNLGSYGPPFTYGGFPFSAGNQGCFGDGETEDYFLEPEAFDVCLWEKALTIDGRGPYMPEEGPFTVAVSDTVLITDTLWCSFDYDWDLWEYWGSSALYLQGGDISEGSADDGPGTPPEWWVHWWGGPILGNPPVQLWKQFHVEDFPNLPEPIVITETLDFSPPEMGIPTWQRDIVLEPFSAYVPLTLKRY